MKNIVLSAATAVTLMSCNTTDPVEFNDNIVNKMDSVVGYQSAFVEDLGKGGDTMKVAYDKLNAYTDKTINSINNLPEYSSGDDFRKSVVQILNNLKTSNVAQGGKMMEIYKKDYTQITDQDYETMDKTAGEYDKIWEDELKKFDEAQKKYAETTGIQIQKVAAPLK